MPTIEAIITREEIIEAKLDLFRKLLEIPLDLISESDIILIRMFAKDTEIASRLTTA